MCLAVIINWSHAEIQIRRLSSGMRAREWERPLLMQWTVASLSQCTRMLRDVQFFPHNEAAITSG